MSKFFNYYPKVIYDITGTGNQPLVVTNILARAKIINSILNNTLVYYYYDVKDSDTPEIIAAKYYGDPEAHWVVLWANAIVDPNYDWPMTYDNFIAYIINKYGSIASAQTIWGFQKNITKVDSGSGTITVDTYTIDANTYHSLPVSTFQEVNMPDGTTVSITTTTQELTNYEYEMNLNESKRKIKIIDKQYLPQIQQELQTLMAGKGP